MSVGNGDCIKSQSLTLGSVGEGWEGGMVKEGGRVRRREGRRKREKKGGGGLGDERKKEGREGEKRCEGKWEVNEILSERMYCSCVYKLTTISMFSSVRACHARYYERPHNTRHMYIVLLPIHVYTC